MKNRQTKKEISLNEYVGFTLKCSTTLSLMVGRKVKNNGKMLKIPEGDRNPRFITLSFSLLYSTISKETGKEKKKKHYHKTINVFFHFLPFFFLRYNFLFYKASGTSLVVCTIDGNPPAKAGHGLDLWSWRIPHAIEQLSLCTITTEPVLQSLEATSAEPTHCSC